MMSNSGTPSAVRSSQGPEDRADAKSGYNSGGEDDLLSIEITEEEIAENSYQVKVPIFKQFQMLDRDGTDTKIDMPESVPGMMTITGRKENVIPAVIQVQKIQNEMANEFPEDGSGSDLEQNLHRFEWV